MKKFTLRARSAFDRFRGILQHFEVIKELIQSEEAEKARMAIILLHSLIDGLMFSIVVGVYEHDQFIKMVCPPKYTSSDRKKTLYKFVEKVLFCQKELELLTEADSEIFISLNFYRNAAYHRDLHNPNVILPIAHIVFHAALRLFRNAILKDFGFGMLSGESISKSQAMSVSRFCNIDSCIYYEKAADEALQILIEGMQLELSTILTVFTYDIKCRLNLLNQMAHDSLYCESRKEFNEILKRAEFNMSGVGDELLHKILELRYRIIDKAPGGKPTSDEYFEAEQKYKNFIEREFDVFVPEVTGDMLDEIAGRVEHLGSTASISKALTEYLNMDTRLVRVEILARYAERMINEAIQSEVDLKKGK